MRLPVMEGNESDGEALALLAAVNARLDAIGLGGTASCRRRSCMGRCIGRPIARVDPDRIWYHRLSVRNLLRIVRDQLLQGIAVEELQFRDDGNNSGYPPKTEQKNA